MPLPSSPPPPPLTFSPLLTSSSFSLLLFLQLRFQKRQLLHEQAVRAAAKVTDPFRCVERLAGATSAEIRRLAAKDAAASAATAAAAAGVSLLAPSSSSNATCSVRLGKLIIGGALVDEPLRVDLKALAAVLPAHVVGCLLSGGDSFLSDEDDDDGDDDGSDAEENKEDENATALKKEPAPPSNAPVPLPALGSAAPLSSSLPHPPPPLSSFARWAGGLTPARVSASCSAEHAARALRLLAAIAHAADAAPGVFAGLAEVTDDGAVVAFAAAAAAGGGGGGSSGGGDAARKKQKTAAPAGGSPAAAPGGKRRANPFRVALVDALALSVCAVASSCGSSSSGGGGGEGGEAEAQSKTGLLAAAASADATQRKRALSWVSLVPAALDAAFSALAPRVPSAGASNQQQQNNRYSVLEDPDARARAAALEVLSSPRASAVVPAVADGVRAGVLATRAALEAWKKEAASTNPSPARANALAGSVTSLAFAAGAGLEELGKALSVPLFYAGFASWDPSLAGLVRCVSEAAALAPVGFHAAEHERREERERRNDGDGGATNDTATLPFATRTALDLLAARGLALFVALSELAEPPFLDVVFESADDDGEGGEKGKKKEKQEKMKPSIRPAAIFTADAALEAAARALRRPAVTALDPPTSAGEGHLASAALAAAELLTDDSNHRAVAAGLLAPALAEALSSPPPLFASSWCCGSDGAARHSADAVNPLDGSSPLVLAPPTPEAVGRALTLARVVEVLRPALVAKAAEAARAAAAAAARNSSGSAANSGARTDSARVEREKAAAAARGATSAAGRCLALFKILGNMQVEDDGGGEEEGSNSNGGGSEPAARKLVRELVRRAVAAEKSEGGGREGGGAKEEEAGAEQQQQQQPPPAPLTAVGACTTALINLRALSAAAARLRKAAEKGAAADAGANPDGSGAFLWYADDLLTLGEQQLLDGLAEGVRRSAAEVDDAAAEMSSAAGATGGGGFSSSAPSEFHAEVVDILRSG